MKKTLLLWSIFLIINQVYAKKLEVTSPNGELRIEIDITKSISWSVFLNENAVIVNAAAGMDFLEGVDFGFDSRMRRHTIKSSSSMIYPTVPHKDAEILDSYTELSIWFKDSFMLKFRAYNDGIAYQFIDEGSENRIVNSELISLNFPEGAASFFPKEESMYSHNEREYLHLPVEDITTDEFCSLPVVFTTDYAKVLFTETALQDYPGMFVRGNGDNSVTSIFPNFVLETEPAKYGSDRNQKINKEADYIAKVSGNKAYPWRVFIISDDDRTFVESNLTYQLANPTQIKNTEWIKPGKVAWDWYNANNVFGVDFKSGLNTDTYKYYIDFAASNSIEYVILDEGWTKSTTEILDVNPSMDVKELIRYAEDKGVGIILWVLWKPLDENLDQILETYKSWGARGIKVDFMQRSDQYMVNSYEEIAKKCAELEMLVDFHGSFKPSGLRRTYPNVVNYEAVKGNENNKSSLVVSPDPEHNVTIPFIRMAAGPMDFTPGSMANRQKNNYDISFGRPMSLGTRAHQVAMYVVYEAPLQMLCESPSIYYKEQETVDFITKIPTIWDETVVIAGELGNYIAVARRKNDTWYIGAMTDWDERELKIDLSFLEDGDYQIEIYADGVNANRYAEDYKKENLPVNSKSIVTLNLAKGGGAAAIIKKSVE